MEPVRLGIVGMGSMGRHHARYLLAGKVPRLGLVAASDADPARLADLPSSVRRFARAEEMYASGSIDAVLVATPHYSHADVGIAALAAGLHLMVEKPISGDLLDARRLIREHGNPRQVFAGMFQMRTHQAFRSLRRCVQEGELGEIQRVNWTVTDWFRTQAYYASSGWRATWSGEGGGVLINQCPHNLDLYQWIFGMPQTVTGFCRFGRYHDIEVEDDVTAHFEHGSGLHATFVASTGEAPGTNRLEIAGDLGRVVYENGRIAFARNQMSAREFIRTASVPTGQYPPSEKVSLPDADEGGKHADAMENFADAILESKPLISPAAEGLHSLELANAILMSSWMGRPVELPLDASAYAEMLRKRARGSQAQPAMTS